MARALQVAPSIKKRSHPCLLLLLSTRLSVNHHHHHLFLELLLPLANPHINRRASRPNRGGKACWRGPPLPRRLLLGLPRAGRLRRLCLGVLELAGYFRRKRRKHSLVKRSGKRCRRIGDTLLHGTQGQKRDACLKAAGWLLPRTCQRERETPRADKSMEVPLLQRPLPSLPSSLRLWFPPALPYPLLLDQQLSLILVGGQRSSSFQFEGVVGRLGITALLRLSLSARLVLLLPVTATQTNSRHLQGAFLYLQLPSRCRSSRCVLVAVPRSLVLPPTHQ